MERYEYVQELGSGNFGVAKLMRDLFTGELVAVKLIERGPKVDKNVEREIINHRLLNHQNIVAFKEVFLTPNHLAIAMEYAAGGELFDRIVKCGRLAEPEARYFFRQLVAGVEHCHQKGILHRDLKLENTLLDDAPTPRVKICDFGYSKSMRQDNSQPKSTVGTPAYIAPEVLSRRITCYGASADVWSCGVALYVMLVGAYPFEDARDPRNFRATIQRILAVRYTIPEALGLSPLVVDLLARIFVADPAQRLTLQGIQAHPWLTADGAAPVAAEPPLPALPLQSLDQIRAVVEAAREVPGAAPAGLEPQAAAAALHNAPTPAPAPAPAHAPAPVPAHAAAAAAAVYAANFYAQQQQPQLPQQHQAQVQAQAQAQLAAAAAAHGYSMQAGYPAAAAAQPQQIFVYQAGLSPFGQPYYAAAAAAGGVFGQQYTSEVLPGSVVGHFVPNPGIIF